jgi:hypothetical protein
MRRAGWGCRRAFPPVFLRLEPETRLFWADASTPASLQKMGQRERILSAS